MKFCVYTFADKKNKTNDDVEKLERKTLEYLEQFIIEFHNLFFFFPFFSNHIWWWADLDLALWYFCKEKTGHIIKFIFNLFFS